MAAPGFLMGREVGCKVNGNMLKLPRAVYDRLFVYQRQGVAWMWNLYQKGFGGILADEIVERNLSLRDCKDESFSSGFHRGISLHEIAKMNPALGDCAEECCSTGLHGGILFFGNQKESLSVAGMPERNLFLPDCSEESFSTRLHRGILLYEIA